MANTLDIQYVESYGTRGTGNLQFDYITGICVNAGHLYVVDSNNNRYQKITTNGAYVSQVGGIMSFPKAIETNGTRIYVSDYYDHKIYIFDMSGNYIDYIGGRGVTNQKLNYPSAMYIYDNFMYVSDKQNVRLKFFSFDTGYFGSEITGMSYVDASVVKDDRAYVVSNYIFSTLTSIKLNSTSPIQNIDIIKGYPTSIFKIGTEYLGVTDNQEGKLYIIDYNFTLITTITGFEYPSSGCADDNYIYITDNHQIKKYVYSVESGLSYVNYFQTLNNTLYPTGRAFWKPLNGVFNKVHEALAMSESRLHTTIVNLQNDIIADNILMTSDAITHWETVFGLTGKGTVLQRVNAIKQCQGYPNNDLARQSITFLQNQFDLAGFDVTIHYRVNNNPQPAEYGLFTYGEKTYGQTGTAYTVCANNIDETLDSGVIFDNNTLLYTFYIGGATLGTSADVPLTQKAEFRNLILKLKPAHTIAILFINYV